MIKMNGVILINKEKNKTSRDIVNELSRIFNTKKVGHTGTLDPIATGVLVVTIGRYTKLNDIIMSTYKEYIAEFKLGILTDTLDSTGNILKEKDTKVDEKSIENAIMNFKGEYLQTVPIYSSVKVNGKKLYEYARNNIDVELPKRLVDIKEIEVLSIKDDYVKIRTLVSKGTYIRSLIRDIGEYLNTYATMTSLMRTKQGKFNIEDCFDISDVKNNNYKLLKIEELIDVFVVDMDDELYLKIKNGVKIQNNYNKEFVLFKYQGKEISVYKKEGDFYRNFLSIDV